MGRSGARVVLAIVSAAAVAVLVSAAPRPTLVGDLAHPHAWLARVGADRAASELALAALWLVACWVALALLACVLARAPGPVAACVARAGQLALPGALRRLVVAATGLGIALTPVAAGASAAPTRPAAVSPAPGWPTDDALQTPAWPAQPSRPAAMTPTPRPKHPAAPAPTPAAPNPGGASEHVVVVQPGDTLWSIAAEHLQTITAPVPSAARVARSWPAWFAANRAVVGDDPDLITPGERLRVPTATDQGEHR